MADTYETSRIGLASYLLTVGWKLRRAYLRYGDDGKSRVWFVFNPNGQRVFAEDVADYITGRAVVVASDFNEATVRITNLIDEVKGAVK